MTVHFERETWNETLDANCRRNRGELHRVSNSPFFLYLNNSRISAAKQSADCTNWRQVLLCKPLILSIPTLFLLTLMVFVVYNKYVVRL